LSELQEGYQIVGKARKLDTFYPKVRRTSWYNWSILFELKS